MAEVLLGQSYFLRFDPKMWRAMQPYPPLGTLYAASALRGAGYEVGLFDATLEESEAAWARALARTRPRFAVLYEDNFNYLSKMCLLRTRQAAGAMIEAARAQGCVVIAAGADATDHADLYLERGADYVLLGEGERTLAELVDRLSGRVAGSPHDVAGLAFAEDGRLVRTGARPPIKELDALAFPAWDLVDSARYRAIWRRRHRYYSVNAVTSRGCPYHCNWCAKPIWGQRYSVRSPENVVAELRWLRRSFDVEHIWFADDILGLTPGWLARFAALVEQEGDPLPFKCLQRADLLLAPGTIDALRRAGARTVWIGAESGSQRILDAMEKGTTVAQIHEAARQLRAARVEVGFFLQFGYPGETLADIDATLRMVRACRPDDVGVSVSYPLRGTRFYEAVRRELGAKQNWRDSSDLDTLYPALYPPAFYRRVHAVVHRELRARRAWEELRLAMRRPTTLRPRHLRRVAGLLLNHLALPIERARMARQARPRPSRRVAVGRPVPRATVGKRRAS